MKKESELISEEFGLSGINIFCYKAQQNVAKEATLIIYYFVTLNQVIIIIIFGGLTLSGSEDLTQTVFNGTTRQYHKTTRFLTKPSLFLDRKSTRLNSSHYGLSRMPSSA